MSPGQAVRTFLFTDIEASTRRWEHDAAAMSAALERHDAIVRDAVEHQDGSLLKHTGDGVVAVFETPGDGLRAAVAIQRGLGEEDVRVRAGLHTGPAEQRAGDWFGPTLNRAARIMSLGRGGHVLLSTATAGAVTGDLPEAIGLLDLGEQLLKGFDQSERIHQAVGEGLTSDRALEPRAAQSMRGTRTSFVGRHTEIDAITRMLDTERCITVTGVGGCGKTRLALEIAHRRAEGFADGIAVAELAPLADADDVARVVADAVGMPVVGASVTRDLSVFLRDRQLLLVLDNCEHLLDACGDLVEELVETCPGVTMLVTSREPLGVDGERAWRAPSLSLPAHDDHDPFAAEAAALFVARAESAQPGFVAADHRQAIISICRGLDGLPLALELAAARTSHLTPEQIAEMLDDRFRLLTGGARRARQRQQTLQAAMDWSHDLLTQEEQRLLRRLSVFAGGWTLDAAVAVAGDGDRVATVDGLGSLVAKSLVVADETEAGMRYRMLETVRLYAQDRLVEAGEAEALRDRQRDWLFRSLGEIRASGGRWVSVISTRAEDELDNLRIALDWSAEQGRGDLATRLIVLTWPMWYVARLSSEARVWLDRFPPDDGALSTAEQVELQIARGFLLQEEMDGSGIVAAGESALALDPTGIASDATGLAWFLRLMVPTFLDPPAAVRIAREALAWLRDYASDGDVADMVTGYCSQSFISDGQWEEARMLAEPLATRDDVLEILRVYAGASVATISLLHGDAEAARERARAIVAGMPARPGRHGDTWAHALLAIAEAACGDAGTSRRALQDTVSVVRRRYAHIPTSWGIPITAAGVILAVEGRDHEAMRLFVAAGAQGRLWHFRQETTFVLHREYSRLVAERLGPEATHQAWSEGEAMTVEAMQDAVDALATEA